jgi:hypothetical protein
LNELEQLLSLLKSNHYQTLGILFFDTKFKMFGIAPVSGASDAMVEMAGKRLGGGKDDKMVWTHL